MEKTLKVTNSDTKIGTQPKIFSGTVVSDKMKDTVVVSVNRFEKHPRYSKFIKRRKKFKAHDQGNTAKIGDKVRIIETRPISKNKSFKLLES
ncbi:MAG: 30S ribosomal protein S17 [Candidatus Zambryskibacteria bacterium CG_4_9_14_3_um_filter_42_9]|uniref:Small ribosomal subunit protein uS17 n=1 Tax=Candidatus Zambryskibacteria bacterium CG22_combo_CG10-13_8_21_14_all_42_17 TaxID=1975118 RepID=A0A2H0BDJ3_9BACT|nr:MAG: 30S ribosomal protein S17 [Candidatus Zambryskibacteria bacterium CG22_combo_CG10-13_8_21_14_all_42_17]PJA36743.1 MAG: 30S ribosomal protein S17 [Candidatus Zambryskibacteria bacterium CG_4_9_14_3_um_filter_42_9]